MAPVRYLVDDGDAAIDSYTTPLGFELADRRGPPFAVVTQGGLTLWLAGPGTSASKPMPDGAAPVPGGWNRIVLQLENFESRVSALRAAGVKFRNEPITGPGGTPVPIEDPAGNTIELFAPRA